MSLQWVGQDDFAVGTLVGVAQDQQVAVGLESAINALFDDDGDVLRRGRVVRDLGAAAPAPLTFVWSGYLGINYVQLVATAARIYAVVANALIDLGAFGVPQPVLPAIVGDLLFMPNGFVWGGSTKANYATGTIAMTAGSPVVTGVGTGWAAANAEPGMLFQRTGGTRWYQIKSVDSATQITLTEPAATNVAAGTAYVISAAAAASTLPVTTRTRHLGVCANRLLIGIDNIVSFSPSGAPFTFNATDFHKLPDGVSIIGVSSIRDQALIFTNYGLWSISNMAFDLTDDFGNPQQTLSRLTPEVSLLHEAGLAEYSGAIIAPCIDRCLLIDGVSPPVSISDSIASIYMTFVRSGARPGGGKVFRNHYFLPWISTAQAPVGLLVCRINRPVRERQLYYPWAQWDGYVTGISAFDVDLRSVPVLRAVHKDGYRVDATGAFPPFNDDLPAYDPDNKPVIFDVETRDFPTAGGAPGHARKLRLRYAVGAKGQIEAGYSFGSAFQRYQDLSATARTYADTKADYPNYVSLLRGLSVDPEDADWSVGKRFWHLLGDQPLVPPGQDPALWTFPQAERPRFIRARFRSTDAISHVTIRRVEFAVRPTPQTR